MQVAKEFLEALVEENYDYLHLRELERSGKAASCSTRCELLVSWLLL
jgi:hypothetical protein